MGLRNAYLTLLEAILSSFKEVNFPTFNILLSFLTWKLKVASFFFSYSIYTLHWHCKNETKGAMTSFAFHTGPFQLQKDSTINNIHSFVCLSIHDIKTPHTAYHLFHLTNNLPTIITTILANTISHQHHLPHHPYDHPHHHPHSLPH